MLPDPEPDPENLALQLDGPKEPREIVRLACRWSRSWQSRAKTDVLERTNKMGAKSTTLTGLSGTGDVMLTCFVILSRNRTVGVHLGSGEKHDDILSSMNQLEGVATAGAVIALAQKYKVKMPVLTAVARIIDNELTSTKTVFELMNLPQVSFYSEESANLSLMKNDCFRSFLTESDQIFTSCERRTEIDTEFVEVMAFRHAHNVAFEKKDFFCSSAYLDSCKNRLWLTILKFRLLRQWMPLVEFVEQPLVQGNDMFKKLIDIFIARLEKRYCK